MTAFEQPERRVAHGATTPMVKAVDVISYAIAGVVNYHWFDYACFAFLT
jgi:hypothetical protein